MAKTIKLIITYTIILTLFSGCSYIERVKKAMDADQELINQCDKVLECLNNDDVEGLKSMFCDAAQDMPGLEEQIQEAMDFFEGATVSHSSYLTSSEKAVDEGEMTFFDASPLIDKVLTDTGRVYTVAFGTIIISKEHPDRVGISSIGIYDENDYECSAGDFYYVNPEWK